MRLRRDLLPTIELQGLWLTWYPISVPALHRAARASNSMTNHARNAIVLFAAVALLAGLIPCLLSAQPVERQQLLDYMERVRDDNDLPGLSVAVAVNGEIVFSEGVGYAELDHRTPQTGRTVHNVGSISKVLAVVGLMRLVEQGKLDLDATIQTYLPYYPEKTWPITVRHILTHTSGTRHYNGVEFGDHRLLAMRHYDDFEEATRLWRDDPLLFEPGTLWSYSSHATNLIHGIVEELAGKDFETYMRRHVFEPASMLASQFDVPSRVIRNRGRGYVRDDQGRFVHPIWEDPSYKYAGGGILSTAEDLVRFAMAINDGTLLQPETVHRMHEPQIDQAVKRFVADGEPQPRDFKQALVWRILEDQAGRTFPSHTGTVKGTRSFLANYHEQGVVVALQANALPFDSPRYGIAIAQMFLPRVR